MRLSDGSLLSELGEISASVVPFEILVSQCNTHVPGQSEPGVQSSPYGSSCFHLREESDAKGQAADLCLGILMSGL